MKHNNHAKENISQPLNTRTWQDATSEVKKQHPQLLFCCRNEDTKLVSVHGLKKLPKTILPHNAVLK